MPLPLILGGAAAIAGAVGIGSAVHGGVKMKEANDTMKWAESKHRESITGFETQNKKTTADMDRLGKKELEILDSFQKFSNIFEQIHNRPEFKPYEKENVSIPAYNAEELKQVSVGAGVLLGGLGGAAVGLAVIQEQRLVGHNLHRGRGILENLRRRLHGLRGERRGDAVKIVVHIQPLLAELHGDAVFPHDGIRVREQVEVETLAQRAQLLEALHGNTLQKLLKGVVNLGVGDRLWKARTQNVVEFAHREMAALQRGERLLLHKIAEVSGRVGQSELLESRHAVLLANVHDDPAQVKKQIIDHSLVLNINHSLVLNGSKRF